MSRTAAVYVLVGLVIFALYARLVAEMVWKAKQR